MPMPAYLPPPRSRYPAPLLLIAALLAGIASRADNLPPASPPAPETRPGVTPLPPLPPLPPDAATLIPGQVIRPIDLASALQLAGARDLDVAVARERVHEALADLQRARVLWLPSIFIGPNWIRHDGQVQVVEGKVTPVSKSSLFLGATAAGGSSVSGPVPAGGPAPISGLTTVLRISDAIFEPLAARQMVTSRQAGIQAATNDALLGVSEAYLDLQLAAGRLLIAREAAQNAEALATLTESYARTGAGLEADHKRSLAEQEKRRREIEDALGYLEVASAEVIRRIRIDPRVVVAPLEPPETVFRFVPENPSLDQLIVLGLRQRPELAEAQAVVDATLVRLRQARMRPLIPSVAFRYSGGGFGGGSNSFFGNFDSRSDADVNLYWELQNLGLADRAIARQRNAQNRIAMLEKLKLQDHVAAEVVAAEKARLAADRQLNIAAEAVPAALQSLQLNFTNIKRAAGLPGATRPIEVLQPIQALAQARSEYLDAAILHNRSEFRLMHAVGTPVGAPVRNSTAASRPGG